MIDKSPRIIKDKKDAGVAELVYALALGASGAIHESPSLSACTNKKVSNFVSLLFLAHTFIIC